MKIQQGLFVLMVGLCFLGIQGVGHAVEDVMHGAGHAVEKTVAVVSDVTGDVVSGTAHAGHSVVEGTGEVVEGGGCGGDG